MEIQEISIPQIHIPDVHIPYTYVPDYGHSNVQVIGCTYHHRDTKNTGNRNLIIEDKNGLVTNCPYPSFNPLDYVPDQLTITEEMPNLANESEMPTSEPPKTEIPKEEKKEEEYKPCPSEKNQRVGDFRNEKRLERVTGHKRGDDGVECITLYEDVPFIDQYIPTPSVVVSTAAIATVAATTPIIINLIKPLVKQIIKKLTSRKSKNENEVSPDQEEL